jgi:hypothetical protein
MLCEAANLKRRESVCRGVKCRTRSASSAGQGRAHTRQRAEKARVHLRGVCADNEAASALLMR